MRIDQHYLKDFLNVFLDSSNHFVTISNFKNANFDIDAKFLFHMQILEDQKFVQAYNENNDLGYHVSLGGNFEWVSQNMRLTASGHEFADSLNKKEIYEVLKEEFKNASVATLSSVAKELMISFAKKQASKHFE